MFRVCRSDELCVEAIGTGGLRKARVVFVVVASGERRYRFQQVTVTCVIVTLLAAVTVTGLFGKYQAV
jgi:hypothetical protein